MLMLFMEYCTKWRYVFKLYYMGLKWGLSLGNPTKSCKTSPLGTADSLLINKIIEQHIMIMSVVT